MAIAAMRERAPYASDPGKSRGRRFDEPISPSRNDFRRDCDRIIHSAAFRRLAHKTQVFVYHEGDHYRTRLTHTLEVAQVARSLARALGADEDLAEALALSHDLGHPPFGHAGERALDECLRGHGGFDHNAQALRIVTSLERRYARFDGLNLTWETLEGLVKHNGPLTDRAGKPTERYREHGVPAAILAYDKVQDLELWGFASVEAQIAALADDIAYDAHDIDDGLRANLFSFDEVASVPVIGAIVAEIRGQHPNLGEAERTHELIRRLITRMIEDVIAQSQARLDTLDARSPEDVRNAWSAVVAFSPPMAEGDAGIKGFLYPQMYRHERVNSIMAEAERVVRELFEYYTRHSDALPPEWLALIERGDETVRARGVADFIAGMTDRYALIEHARYFANTPELR